MKIDDLEKARKAQLQSDRHFYFDDNGIIKYYGRADTEEYIDYHHAQLTYDQCKIIEEGGKSVNDFIILMDPANEGVFTLVNKQIELESFKSATKMLSLIRKKEKLSSSYDVKIEYDPSQLKENLVVEVNDKLRNNVVKNVKVQDFTFKGANFFNLYFTTKNDPHFMFETVRVDLAELFRNKKIVFDVKDNLTHCDIFTKRVFDKYEYRVKT